ncbi:MAG TPA: prolipoprotein diacylglyceryl transferase [Nitrospiraceae bacterium]|jgi:phosphatidylglycerol:prolipoprotein diacylglycerol transferase|nr:prolipoprotein diacylglyceryl transferase [Nitrospiraceae bacterium]
MHPVFIRIGPLTIHSYGVFIAAGILIGLFLAVRQGKKQGIPAERIMDVTFYLLLSAIIGSRLLFVAISAPYYREHPLDIFKIWEGGLVFYGGLILAVPVAIWSVRRNRMNLWDTADIFAPSLAIGHAVGRLGCFAAGCCYGKPAYGLPWAVTFSDPECLANVGIPLHPVQVYESIGELLNFFFLIILRKRQSFKGQLFWTYILVYSLLRLTVEFFRGDEVRGFIVSGISVSQGISILTAVLAVVMLRRLSPKSEEL